jgi:uncharacterized protein (TIGR03435 family)
VEVSVRALRLLASVTAIVSIAAGADVFSQSPTFEVVSIRQNIAEAAGGVRVGSNIEQRPDGGITFINIPVTTIIAYAYPASVPRETMNLPEWARRERYDVRATSTLASATIADRAAMLKAMLADRFKLAVHFEPREQPAFDLILARAGGSSGPGLTQTSTQCPTGAAGANSVAGSAPSPSSSATQSTDLKSPPPPCALRIVGQCPLQRDLAGQRGQSQPGDLLEGEATIATLAEMLRLPTRRFVVDKTGLAGTYRIALNFDMAATLIAPTLDPSRPSAGLSVFDAVERQLGLKLESSRVVGEALVIDRLERPTEN